MKGGKKNQKNRGEKRIVSLWQEQALSKTNKLDEKRFGAASTDKQITFPKCFLGELGSWK